jgi:hypothetical protein
MKQLNKGILRNQKQSFDLWLQVLVALIFKDWSISFRWDTITSACNVYNVNIFVVDLYFLQDVNANSACNINTVTFSACDISNPETKTIL